MSFYLRTSVTVGPVRVNMSRAGMGASVGVPGFRLGAGPRGTYISLGDGLVSYRATVRSPHGKTSTGTVPAGSQVPPSGPPSPSDIELSDVSGATALDMTEVESSDLVTQLNEAAGSPRFWPWCLGMTLALAFLSPLVLLAGVPLTVWLFWKDQVRRNVVAFYDVHGEEARRFQRLVDAFGQASAAQRAWHVVAAGTVSTTHQHKVNAGASALINRLPLTREFGGPPNLTSNIAVPSLSTQRRSVYFLPDRILVRDGRQYADVAYRHSCAKAVPQRFIEDGAVPSDSELVEYTWQYVNVKGGPDRRFKNNRQLPILRYGRLTLTGEAGYHAIFDFSTTTASSALAGALQDMTTAEPPGPRNRTIALRPDAARGTRQPKTSQPRSPASGHHPIRNGNSVAPAALPLSRRRLSAEGRLPIVGESQYQPALHRLANGVEIGSDFNHHVPVVAILVPEPENRHDRNAVRVDVATGTSAATVGYLSRYDAPAYQAALSALGNGGYVGTCPGRITGGGRGRAYGMYLHLAGADALLLENLTGELDLLDPARQVTVTKEEDHQAVLARHHSPSRMSTRIAAQLVSSTVSSGKHKGSYAIEVRLDGDRVGELTAAMSARYRHLVAAAVRQSGQANCEGLITHGTRGFQIDLRLPIVNPGFRSS